MERPDLPELPDPWYEDFEDTTEEKQARWRAEHSEEYLKVEGCKEFAWGFCIGTVKNDATAVHSKAVGAIMEMIGSWTNLDALLDRLCFLFRWKLTTYRDQGGKTLYKAFDSENIPNTAGQKSAIPPWTLPPKTGHVRSWIKRTSDGGWYGDDEEIVQVVWPNAWTLLAGTRELRSLLLKDALNFSKLASAQCADGRWSLTTNAKAMKDYR